MTAVVVAAMMAPSTARAEIAAPPLCDVIAAASQRYDLPLNYFTRLIWQESRFHPDAISPAGAQGVAQFMPATAADRALADPFSTRDALFASAAYLGELRTTYGNLGLAAAAYNAGPGRVARWLAGSATLPTETINYVVAVTGHDVSEWTGATKLSLTDEKDFSCAHFADRAGQVSRHIEGATGAIETKEWAAILLGSPRRDKALSEYQIVRGTFSQILGSIQPSIVHRRIGGLQIARYIVEVEHHTRGEADAFCARLSRAGGSCFVLRTGVGMTRAKTAATPSADNVTAR